MNCGSVLQFRTPQQAKHLCHRFDLFLFPQSKMLIFYPSLPAYHAHFPTQDVVVVVFLWRYFSLQMCPENPSTDDSRTINSAFGSIRLFMEGLLLFSSRSYPIYLYLLSHFISVPETSLFSLSRLFIRERNKERSLL